MEASSDHTASIVSITGKTNQQLYLLANLYREPLDPESIVSAVITLTHKPDVRWRTMYTNETWCTSMDQAPDGALFVVSMEGELHAFRDNQWSVLNLECDDGLNSVWAVDNNEAFAVGVAGEIIRILGNSFEVIRSTERYRLNAIRGSSRSNVIAVGDAGRVLKFNGKNWEKVELPTNVNILTVFCHSDKEVFVGGVGVLFKWDGVTWHEIGIEQVTITDCAYYKGSFYFACGRYGIHILEEDKLKPFKELLVYRLNAIGNSLFAVGNRLVAQYDGISWWGGDLDL